jgi:hypothetical protein
MIGGFRKESQMKKLGLVAVLLTGLLAQVGTGPVGAQGSPSPPTDLKKVGDHWTPWDPPPPGPDHYIIQKGDTLWDLAGEWFDDPFLWPQIWDENRYILDSHWIYPGDPLVVPGRPTVVTEASIPPAARLTPVDEGEGGEGGEGAGAGEAAGDGAGETAERAARTMPPPLMPAADASDLYCSGYISDTMPMDEEPELFIVGRHDERFAMGEGNVVFINRGRNAGIRAGDEFELVRRETKVQHPGTKNLLGTYVQRLGKARVLIAHEESATVVVEMSCEEIYEGDELVPWERIKVPMFTTRPRFDPFDPTPSAGPKGHVVWQRDDISAFGTGHVIYTDLGRVSGASPGDFVQLFRERDGDQPRRNLGQAVILTVGPNTSAAKITYSVIESKLGDRVELLTQ